MLTGFLNFVTVRLSSKFVIKLYLNIPPRLKHVATHTHAHARTRTQPFNGLLSRTTRVGQYQKKHSPIHTHPDHHTSFINVSISQVIGCEDRLRNDLYCVGWGVKLYSNQTNPLSTSSISMASFLFSLHFTCLSPFRQPLSRSSLIFFLVLDPLLHTPCITQSSVRYFVKYLCSKNCHA